MTVNQQKVFEYMQECYRKIGIVPGQSIIGSALEMSEKQIGETIKQLKRDGYIRPVVKGKGFVLLR